MTAPPWTETLNIKSALIPKLGFRTYGMSVGSVQCVLVAALKNGFRHIDTAQIYQNEEDVRVVIRGSGIPRAVFVTTKVWVANYS